jgi:hypothetical protein
MRANTVRITDKNDNLPAFGERAAEFVETYLREHPGLSSGELAFRLKADKRDLRRLLNDKSIGKPLEERLHAYFGRIFGEAVYGCLWGDGPSAREQELAQERANIAARRERLERERPASWSFRSDPSPVRGVRPDEDRSAGVS